MSKKFHKCKNCPKETNFSKIVKKKSTLSKIVKTVTNYQNGQKLSKLSKNCQKYQYGKKMPKRSKNVKVVKKLKIEKLSKKIKFVQNC